MAPTYYKVVNWFGEVYFALRSKPCESRVNSPILVISLVEP